MSSMAHHAPGHAAFPVLLTLFLFILAIFYLRGWLTLRSSSRESSALHLFSFLVGLVLLWAASASPLASYVHRLLTAHMVQHLVLMTVAPALILLGNPLKVTGIALPPLWARTISTVLRVPPFPQLGRILVNPVVCWLAATGVLMGWHIPPIFALSLDSPLLHQFEQFTFVFAGLLFWWPVIQPWPSSYTWPRWLLLLYLFLATLPCDILSAYLTFCDRVVYAPYLQLSPPASVLRDQEFAGALMWTCITLLYLIPAALLTIRLLERPSQEL